MYKICSILNIGLYIHTFFPGIVWFQGFMKSHPNLRQKKAMILGEQRCQVTQGKLMEWFHEVEVNLGNDGHSIIGFPPERLVVSRPTNGNL